MFGGKQAWLVSKYYNLYSTVVAASCYGDVLQLQEQED